MSRLRRFLALAPVLALMAALLPMLASTADASESTAPGSSFELVGTTGDYITGGNDIAHSGSTVEFVPTVNYDNGISVRIDVRDANGTFLERWSTDFAAPDEVPLVEGDAFGATRWPFQAAGVAGLSVTGDGRGCNQSTGEFIVYELVFAVDGSVETFSADFRQSCDGGAAMTGGVRVNSTIGSPDPDFTLDGGNPGGGGDTTPPEASATLTQTGRIKRNSSAFFVGASCSDNEPGVSAPDASINGYSVTDGQKVTLALTDGDPSVRIRKGKLTIRDSSFTLTVSCVDAAGNTTIATATADFG